MPQLCCSFTVANILLLVVFIGRYDEIRCWFLEVFDQEDMFSPSDGTVSIHHRFILSMSSCEHTPQVYFEHHHQSLLLISPGVERMRRYLHHKLVSRSSNSHKKQKSIDIFSFIASFYPQGGCHVFVYNMRVYSCAHMF